MKRPQDRIEIRGPDGVFDAFDSVEISSALNAPTECRLHFGDDGAWDRLEPYVRPGAIYDVLINGRPFMRGRVESSEGNGAAGVEFDVMIRTKLSDARYSSADPSIKVQNVSLKEFILSLFRGIGLRESDFLFAEATNRDLITGKATGAKVVDLEPIQLQQAKVQPPETIWECARRHLERHGLMLWEAVDGRVCVGQPDDQQAPIYRIVCKRPNQGANNVMRFRRIRDWSEIAQEVKVFGFTPGKDLTKAPVQGRAVDQDVVDVFAETGHFGRFVSIPLEKAKSDALAQRQATRELSARRRRKDAWEFQIDGLTYWNGDTGIVWTFNAVADVDVDTAGGPAGPYLITRVAQTMSVEGATSTTLSVIAPGLWVLE